MELVEEVPGISLLILHALCIRAIFTVNMGSHQGKKRVFGE